MREHPGPSPGGGPRDPAQSNASASGGFEVGFRSKFKVPRCLDSTAARLHSLPHTRPHLAAWESAESELGGPDQDGVWNVGPSC